MKKLYEVECQRSNTTPKAFFNYCEKQAAKHGCNIEDWANFEDWANETNNTPYSTDEHSDWDTPQREANKCMPYATQMYLQGAYNFILEFDFDDDSTGHGYFFAVEYER